MSDDNISPSNLSDFNTDIIITNVPKHRHWYHRKPDVMQVVKWIFLAHTYDLRSAYGYGRGILVPLYEQVQSAISDEDTATKTTDTTALSPSASLPSFVQREHLWSH